MRTKKMRKVLKWTSYVLFALVLFCFEIAPVKIPLFEQVVYLLPFVIAFACREEIIPTALFAAVCGLFIDYSMQRQFGYNAIILCVLSVVVWVCMRFFVRPIFISIVISVAASTLVYCLLDFFFFFVITDIEKASSVLFSVHFPVFLKTSLFGAGIAYVNDKIYSLSPIRAKFDAD